MEISGLSIAGLQVFAAGLLAAWLAFPAWLLYRELTGSSVGATIASAIIFVQPEFLFLVLRGTHEKFTRGMMFLCLYLIARSLRSYRRVPVFAGLLLASYLISFGLITFNTFQASSFILAMGVALVLTWFGMRVRTLQFQGAEVAVRRLGLTVLIMMAMSFIFIFYVYPPARHSLFIMESVADRVARLFLDVEQTITAESYEYINWGWTSLPMYLTLTLANWLTLLGSAGVWLWWTWRWFSRGLEPERLHELALWAFYGAFTFLGVASILVDVSGTVIGNLQHRLFPTFTMLAAPLLAWWLIEHPPQQFRRAIYTFFPILIGLIGILSIMKATNEPLVSNKWTFFLPAERTAVQWADINLEDDRFLWGSFDDRLYTTLGTSGSGSLPSEIQLDTYEAEISTRDFLISELTRKRSLRLGLPLPVDADSLVVYDNGQAQIYHLRPRTPFQR
jgi:hypothetical protein